MKRFIAGIWAVLFCVSGAFAMTPEEEAAAWKNEPAYGKVIKVGYNGGLCTGTLGITQAKGFFAAEGLNVELVRYQGDTVTLGDALGTGKIDMLGVCILMGGGPNSAYAATVLEVYDQFSEK